MTPPFDDDVWTSFNAIRGSHLYPFTTPEGRRIAIRDHHPEWTISCPEWSVTCAYDTPGTMHRNGFLSFKGDRDRFLADILLIKLSS